MTPGEIPLKQAEEPTVVQPAASAAAPAEQAASEAAPAEKPAPTKGPDDVNEESLRETLQKVVDPELHMNIVELGLVYKVDVLKQGGPVPDVEVEMTLTSPGCPYGPMILAQIPTAIKQDYGDHVGEVNVGLTFTPPWDPATMASEDVQFELGIF